MDKRVAIKDRPPFGAFECRKCKKAVAEAHEITTVKKTKNGEMFFTEWECEGCHVD
ncbi:MAG: hypothetical protein ACXAC5_03765 [Promethearchaeota archaeon]